MAELLKQYPAYEGPEPYIYFAFCRADIRRVEPLLALLYRRGCRIWFDASPTSGAAGRQHRLERSLGASLVVIYLSEHALADGDEVKSAVLYCQSRGLPVICLDAVPNDDLSTGFSGSTCHILPGTPEETESRIIRAEGFTRQLLGSRPIVRKSGRIQKLLSAVLALVLIALGGLYALGAFAPKDTVAFADPVIADAARAEVGLLTPESIQTITVLQLEGVPETLTDLDRLTGLTRVEIPQEAVPIFSGALNEGFTVVVTGGGSHG